MKNIPRYITSFQIQNQQTDRLNISLGSEKNGALRLFFGDAAELGQDSNYINDSSFPNSGLMTSGKYSMWLSMFARHIKRSIEDEEFG
ncbi:MAG: hypothetical protein PHU34_03055 [Candidatus Methanoperedens sp.]|nr:hypothetical protein [Candidatus Methanoperedens sp.]